MWSIRYVTVVSESQLAYANISIPNIFLREKNIRILSQKDAYLHFGTFNRTFGQPGKYLSYVVEVGKVLSLADMFHTNHTDHEDSSASGLHPDIIVDGLSWLWLGIAGFTEKSVEQIAFETKGDGKVLVDEGNSQTTIEENCGGELFIHKVLLHDGE